MNTSNPSEPNKKNSNLIKSNGAKVKPKKSLKEDFVKMLRRYVSLTEKELRVLVRDKAAMLIMFAIPIIVILILTLGASSFTDSTPKELPKIGLIDVDDSEGFPDRDLSQEMVHKFELYRDNKSCELYITNNQSELELMMGHGKLSAFVIIPPLFEFNLSIHIPVILTVVFDTIDTMGLQSAQTVISEIIETFRQENNFTGVFNTQKTYVNQPKKAEVFFAAAPYLIPLILFGIGSLTSTQAIVSDIPKDRMVLTPTNKAEMLAAKVTANQLLLTMLSIIFMTTSAIVELPIRTSWFNFFIVLFLLSLNAAVVGVLISSMSKTPLSAFQYFIFIFLFMVIVIFFVDDPNITMWMPIQCGSDLVMGVILRGQNFWSVRATLRNLIIETIVLYIVSYILFKTQKNML